MSLRAWARTALLLWSLATLAAGAWVMAQNPLAAPLAERGLDQARAALTRATAARATPDWLIPRIEAALEADDRITLQVLADLAADQRTPLPADLDARLRAALDPGAWQTVGDCGSCMLDVTQCPSLALVAACTLPFELSPAGDAAALMRQGGTWAGGGEPDRIEVALATLGLAATAGTLVTAGGSLSVKGAATTLRVARRADALSPGMTRALAAAARSPDPARALGDIATDLRRIGAHTSIPEVLPILRLADGPEDLRALSRLSEAAGPVTSRHLAVLGKGGSLRLLHRLSDLAMAALALAALILSQLAGLLAALAQLALRRLLRPERRGRTRVHAPSLRTAPPPAHPPSPSKGPFQRPEPPLRARTRPTGRLPLRALRATPS